ncbi:MAG TPA: hypothetical protein VD772_12160, partial [Anseongella sp.]|nr:hypothetical protein [Anseongella sp.]
DFSILDDAGEPVKINAVRDEAGVLYWHRRILTGVCLTGECKMVDVGLYWYCTGDFMGLEVYREPLTKTDHSVFSAADYEKLLSVLGDDWSILREYELSDLVEENGGTAEAAESGEGVDATTGATKKEIAEAAVEDAAYTTFTLWHLVHVGEKEQLTALTAGLLDQGKLAVPLLRQGEKRYKYFLLELLAGKRIAPSETMTQLLIEGLNAAGDPALRNLAINALSHADPARPLIQAELAKTYPRASLDEKLRILAALEGLRGMDAVLRDALTADLSSGNEWFSIRLLKVLKSVFPRGDEMVAAAEKLLESDNPVVREAAKEFIDSTKQ